MELAKRYNKRKNIIELRYIWIENYKNIIIEQGFNFGSENLYKYENNILYKEKNKNYTKNFFGDSIVNITGIIGKNGTGKSTLLDFIKENLTNSLNEIKDRALVILNIDGKDIIYKHPEIEVENSNHFDEKLSFSGVNKESNVSIVYFSNIFDLKGFESNRGNDNILDISTNHLLRTDKYTNEEEDENTAIGEVEAHRIAELHRHIEFNFGYKLADQIIDFSVPREIEVIPMDIEYYSRLEEHYFDDELENIIIYDFLNKIEKITLKSKIESEKYKYEVMLLLIENLLYTADEFFNKEYNNLLNIIVKQIDKLNHSKKEMIEEFKSFFDNVYLNMTKNNTSEYLLRVIEASTNIYNLICNMDENKFNNGKLILDKKERIFDFLRFYYNAISNTRIFYLKWRNLSSGQAALLSMFSRIHYYRGRAKENIILLIKCVDYEIFSINISLNILILRITK